MSFEWSTMHGLEWPARTANGQAGNGICDTCSQVLLLLLAAQCSINWLTAIDQEALHRAALFSTYSNSENVYIAHIHPFCSGPDNGPSLKARRHGAGPRFFPPCKCAAVRRCIHPIMAEHPDVVLRPRSEKKNTWHLRDTAR